MAAEGGVVAGHLGAGSFVEAECVGEGWDGLEPFFFDEAVAVAESAAAEERRRQRQEAEEKEKAKAAVSRRWGPLLRVGPAHKAALERIYEYDPKLGCFCYTRFPWEDLSKLDLDEESPLGPMRYADAHPTETATNKRGRLIYKLGDKWFVPCDSANIFSVKILSSDVGFPIDVYGTVIARDALDYKCVYLYNRDRDHCQQINSADDQLILTGPKRGLALVDAIYIETNLKIKGDQGQDRVLSKRYFGVNGIKLEKMVLKSETLHSFLSTVEVTYAFVERAVEAAIAVEVIQGEFQGKITAHTSSTHDRLVLYDSQVAGLFPGDGNRTIQLPRPIVCVYQLDKLIVNIVDEAGAGKSEQVIEFGAAVSGGDKAEITCGSFKMLVKITWSVIRQDFCAWSC